jgi:phage/plasmid-associated DNA primase
MTSTYSTENTQNDIIAKTLGFSWKLAKKGSIFTKNPMFEHVKYAKIIGFLSNGLGIKYSNIRRYNYLVENGIQDEKLQIEKYKELYDRKTDRFKTKYNLAKHKWGRVQPVNHLSLSIMHRPTRHALCEDAYVDIDMCCAHPQIIVEMCRLAGMENAVLAIHEYVKNSKKYRYDLMEMHGVSYDAAKQLAIRLMFGGDYDAWKKDFGVTDEHKLHLMKEYQAQLQFVSEVVYEKNPDILKDVMKATPDKWKDVHAKKRGVMSLWCLTMERYIQECAISYLVSTGRFKLQDIVPCQDGFMIPKELFYDELVAECETAVYNQMGIHMPFLQKPFDEAIEIPECQTPTKTIAEWEDYLSVKCLANKFNEDFGDHILRDKNGGSIYLYHEGRWYDETKKTERRFLTRYISEDLFETVRREIESDISLKTVDSDRMMKLLRNNCSSSAKLNDIIMHIISVCNPLIIPFDSKPFLLGFENGVFDLNNNEFRDYRYNDYMTMSVGYDYTHTDLDCLSEEENEIRTQLIDIFNDIQPNHDEMLLMMQILASGLDGISYQKLALFCGKGGNGKGLIGSLMDTVLGDYYGQPSNGILKDAEKANNASPDMLGLMGKRYINFKEVGGVLQTNMLRNLTGGGKFIGRQLYGNNVSFKMSGTFVMEFNNHPDLDGKPQESDYRRMLSISYPTNFTTDPNKVGRHIGGCDYKLANPYYETDAFREEARGIFLDMLLRTYNTYMKDDGSGITFTVPQSTIDKTAKYLLNQNVFAQAFDMTFEKCEIMKNEKGKLDKADLKRKTFSMKQLWAIIQKTECYRSLQARDKRNQYGMTAFGIWLDETFGMVIKNHIKCVVGIIRVDRDGDEDGDEDEDSDEES